MNTPTLLTTLVSTALLVGCDFPTNLGTPAEGSTGASGLTTSGTPGRTSGVVLGSESTSSDETPDSGTDTDIAPAASTSIAATEAEAGIDTDAPGGEGEGDSTSTGGYFEGGSDESGPTMVVEGQCPVALEHALSPDYAAVVYHGGFFLPNVGYVGEADDLIIVFFGGALEDECSAPRHANTSCGKDYVSYVVLPPQHQEPGVHFIVGPDDDPESRNAIAGEVKYFHEIEEDFCCVQSGLSPFGFLTIETIDETGITGSFELGSGIFGTVLEGAFVAEDCGAAESLDPGE